MVDSHTSVLVCVFVHVVARIRHVEMRAGIEMSEKRFTSHGSQSR